MNVWDKLKDVNKIERSRDIWRGLFFGMGTAFLYLLIKVGQGRCP